MGSRRAFILSSVSLVPFAVGCARENHESGVTTTTGAQQSTDKGAEVTATEDLMREHGVIRRILVVYREAAARLRHGGDVPPAALAKAAALFRSFGEDYHEKKLEEAYVFPALERAGGQAASLVPILTAQHERGREITTFVLASLPARVGARAAPLASALEEISRMYESHAAREDTIAFQAWRKTMSAKEQRKTADRFEAIERDTFGHDGFEDALGQIAEIETAFGLGDLAAFTAPAVVTPG